MAEQPRKQSLTTEIETARAHLAACVSVLRKDLDVGTRVKARVARNPVAWLSGAAIVGLLLSMIPGSRRKVVVRESAGWNHQAEKAGKAAFLLTALKFGLNFAKPAIVTWVKKKILDREGAKKVSR